MIDSLDFGDKLRELIISCKKNSETSIIEYKVIPHDIRKAPCEFYRDILGLLNAFERPDEDRFLVYGVEDEQRLPLGYEKGLALDSATYEQWFDKISPQPSIEFHNVDASLILDVEPGTKEFSCFYIPSTNFGEVYELNTAVWDPSEKEGGRQNEKKRRQYEIGTSFYRHGSMVSPMREDVRQQIRSMRKQDRSADYGVLLTSLDANGILVLLVASCFGAWDMKNENDMSIISASSDVSIGMWNAKTAELMIKFPGLFRKAGTEWSVVNRIVLLSQFHELLDTQHLEAMKQQFIIVLSQMEKRKNGAIGSKPIYSDGMRQGVAEFLAILGSKKFRLSSCRHSWLEGFIYEITNSVMGSMDWEVLASSDKLFPFFAEASPSLYLSQIESALPNGVIASYLGQNTFRDYGAKPGYGFLRGVEYAARMESLASSSLRLLVDLSRLTPLASDALVMLLLPWLPKIALDVEARCSLGGYLAEHGCWSVLVRLLPNVTTTALRVDDPKYLDVELLSENVPTKEYWEVSKSYTEAAISASANDYHMALELIGYLSSIGRCGLIGRFCDTLTFSYCNDDEQARFIIWSNLRRFLTKCLRCHGADWVPDDTALAEISDAVSKLIPGSAYYRARYWFTFSDHDYFEDREWDKGNKALLDNRVGSLEAYYEAEGWNGLRKLVESDVAIFALGIACAHASFAVDLMDKIYPRFPDIQMRKFSKTFYSAWGSLLGDELIAIPENEKWTEEEACFLLSCLPYSERVWEAADSLLSGDVLRRFWAESAFCKTPKTSDEANRVLSAYVEAGRLCDAVILCFLCIEERVPFSSDLAFASIRQLDDDSVDSLVADYLWDVLHSIEGSVSDYDLAYEELRLISAIEEDRRKTLFLINYMSYSAEFFHFVLSNAYNSAGLLESCDSRSSWLSRNSFDAIWCWRTVPGTLEDGSFDGVLFDEWVNRVLELAGQDGLAEICETTIGACLYHAPADHTGLFILEHIAVFLENHPGALRGFEAESINSRGVFNLDGTGNAFFAISKEFAEKSQQLERKGLLEFAATTRRISANYRKDGEDDIARYEMGRL